MSPYKSAPFRAIANREIPKGYLNWIMLLASSAVSTAMLCIFASPCDALAEQSAPALLASELADKAWLDFHGLRPCDP